MAEPVNDPMPLEGEEEIQEETLGERFMDWVRTELVWYAGSFAFHLILLSTLLLMPTMRETESAGDAPVLEAKQDEPEKKEPEKFEKVDIGEIEETPPPDLDVDPTLEKPAQAAQDAEYNNDDTHFEHKGGGVANSGADLGAAGGGALAFGPGPKVTGTPGLGTGIGTGKNAGSGGDGSGFGGRGSGSRKAMLASGGGTKHTERAVTAALVWLANHQLSDGSWSLTNYTQRCTDKTCTGTAEVQGCDSGGTAMGLLPFLAAGQTHKSKGHYKEHILRGIEWLVRHQTPDGNLAKGAQQMMYSHGLATIALCEAYGLTGDRDVGMHAQQAVNFILKAQNQADGGWRYNPGDPGDTSVVGWQLMALKSAHMAGLDVGGSVFSGTSKWLDSVAVRDGTEYSYQPGQGGSNTMTSVGLLCRQYLGAKRDNPMLVGGMAYLLNHLPDQGFENVYYWYYATQVMHNMSGYEWDTWNRKMRDILVHSQVRNTDNCANGSWAPEKDQWGRRGGRVMQTSLSALTLEIYYRYLPLFKADAAGGDAGVANAKAQVLLPEEGGHAKPGKKAGDKGADEKATDDKAADDKSADDKPAEKPAADKTAPDKKAAAKTPADKKAADKAAAAKKAADKAAAKKPADKSAAAKKPPAKPAGGDSDSDDSK